MPRCGSPYLQEGRRGTPRYEAEYRTIWREGERKEPKAEAHGEWGVAGGAAGSRCQVNMLPRKGLAANSQTRRDG